jgi:predicted nucleic acid-binding protein
MIAVLDVSAAKEKSGLFQAAYEEASWIIAPDLYVSELTNVLWKYHRAKALSHGDCVQYAEDGICLVDDIIASRDFWKESLGEGMKLAHPIYDMYYAILARRNDATLITNDRQLASICKKLKIKTCI